MITTSDGSAADEELRARANQEQMEEKWQALARRDSRIVETSRFIVVIVLIVAATLGALSIHRYVKADQRENFETDYRANATRLIEALHSSVEAKMQAINARSVSMTSFAR